MQRASNVHPQSTLCLSSFVLILQRVQLASPRLLEEPRQDLAAQRPPFVRSVCWARGLGVGLTAKTRTRV